MEYTHLSTEHRVPIPQQSSSSSGSSSGSNASGITISSGSSADSEQTLSNLQTTIAPLHSQLRFLDHMFFDFLKAAGNPPPLTHDRDDFYIYVRDHSALYTSPGTRLHPQLLGLLDRESFVRPPFCRPGYVGGLIRAEGGELAHLLEVTLTISRMAKVCPFPLQMGIREGDLINRASMLETVQVVVERLGLMPSEREGLLGWLWSNYPQVGQAEQ